LRQLERAQAGIVHAGTALREGSESLGVVSGRVTTLQQSHDAQHARATSTQAALGALQRRSSEARRQAEALNRAALLAHRLGLNWLESESGRDPASLSLTVRETVLSLRQAMDLALLEPGALDRRWFDTHALSRSLNRLTAIQKDPAIGEALNVTGAKLLEQSSHFVSLLCDGQIERATQLSQELEAGREALLGQLSTLLSDA
jgi:methyl-accepting chemotaxis protein